MLAAVKIVLVAPSHPGNIGAVARAMKTMGLSRLVLVRPLHFPHPEAVALASGAGDVLDAAVVVDSLEHAVQDCQWVCGTTARVRDLEWPMMTPECMAVAAKQRLEQGAQIAVVFGTERRGLSNHELWLCHAGVVIPGNPVYNSLNLAQAVQIIAYELFKVSGDFNLMPSDQPLVSVQGMEQFYQQLQEVLVEIGFMHMSEPKRLLPKLRRLFNRATVEVTEMNILRGILTQILKLKRGL